MVSFLDEVWSYDICVIILIGKGVVKPWGIVKP
jgi:hypothetical protein